MVTDLNNLKELQDSAEFSEELFEVVGCSDENIEKLTTAPYSYWKSVGKQLLKNKVAIACMIIMALLIFFTIFGPMIYSYDGVFIANYQKVVVNPFSYFTNVKGESIFAPFGSSFEGFDLWTRIWKGAQFSLRLAVVVALIDVVVGLVIGGLWGYIRALDPIMIEISNVISNVPTLLIYIMVLDLLPNSGNSEGQSFLNSVLVM